VIRIHVSRAQRIEIHRAFSSFSSESQAEERRRGDRKGRITKKNEVKRERRKEESLYGDDDVDQT